VANSHTPRTEQRVIWAFWLACGLAVLAGIAPLAFGGGSSRLGGVVFPFALAAIGLGACALLYKQGRPITAVLYFLASLTIVYGILAMLALPLRLSVLGTCPPAPSACAPGLERPLTSEESTALGFAVGIGIVAILTGFFGLVTLYRRQTSPAPLPAPPIRQISPVGAKKPAESVSTAPVPAPAVAAEPVLVSEPKPESEPESEHELPAHTPDLELAAPVEPLELPEVGTADRVEVTPPAPQPKPRRKRVPKATPAIPPPTPDTDPSA
jgi:hypothetical protein